MEAIKGPGYEIMPDSIMFLDRVARKSNGIWQFDEQTAARINSRTVEMVYADFERAMANHRQYKGSYSKIFNLSISPCHAIALYAHGVITDEMFNHIELPNTKAYHVIGMKNDGMPILEEVPVKEEISCMYFAKQSITFKDEAFQASILITASMIELQMHLAIYMD